MILLWAPENGKPESEKNVNALIWTNPALIINWCCFISERLRLKSLLCMWEICKNPVTQMPSYVGTSAALLESVCYFLPRNQPHHYSIRFFFLICRILCQCPLSILTEEEIPMFQRHQKWCHDSLQSTCTSLCSHQ